MAMKTCFTPIVKQCLVILGVVLNVSQLGLVMGFSSALVPQLRRPTSRIPIDEESGSWIASIPAITFVFGNLTIPFIMGKFGRKIGNIINIILSIGGWTSIALSDNLPLLLAARSLQGMAAGMAGTLCPLLIGEYSSPKNRGVFLMCISISIGTGVLFIHTMGSYLQWEITAYICTTLSLFTLVAAVLSPESPSWLAEQGRYEECRKNFRWLRGDAEEDELVKMIEASEATRKVKEAGNELNDSVMVKTRKALRFYGQTVKKSDFYKPLLIMIHIYALAHWSGLNLLATYAVDFISSAVGKDVNIPVIVLSLDILRVVSNLVALIVIKNIKRRTVLFITIGMNIVSLILLAIQDYAKRNDLLPYASHYDYYVSIALVNLLILSVSIGALPMGFILAGEIFPLQYKGIASGISCTFFSIHSFVSVKTVPFLVNTINMYGVYLLYSILVISSLVVVGVLLPETKDKTLLEIEEEFKGIKKTNSFTEKESKSEA